MSRLLHTTFLPSTSLPSRTQPSAPTFRVKPRLFPIQAKIREIFMPALSSTMTEGKIVSWIKSEGDKLSKGESVVVVESDKADMDVETFYDGYLAAIMVEEGGIAPVGSAIALLAETEAEIADARAKSASGGAGRGVSLPAPEAVAVPQTSIASAVAVPQTSIASAVAVPQTLVASAVHPASEGGKRVVASPYAKKIAKELNVELAGLVGSGPMGRIVAKDVEAAVGAVEKEEEVVVGSGVVLGTVVPHTPMQAAVSRIMVEAMSVPVFRVGYTINTDAFDALYKKIKSKGVTKTALLVKATALALAKHPVVNAACKDGNSFVYNSRINIAVAVALDDGGLTTPVLENADKVDVYSLGRKWKELLDKARTNQLQPHEFTTGTFTLSNLGMYGVDRFSATLPPGTGAIMAVGASQPTVVATKDGRIGVKSQMQVNVTADHRIIYGADLAKFLQTLSSIIEDPKDLTF